ncbi:MAG: periplasmic heavy metal sensor [Armatimonadota bacterium]|nr:periplasmic heavy metal sensor [Armatimonadota bacterium]
MRILFGSLIIAAVLVAGQTAARATADEPDVVEQSWEDAVAVTLAQAAPPQSAAVPRPGATERLRRQLNLSDDQARRVEQVLAAYRTRTARLRIDLARARLDGREAMLEPTPDRARLHAVARRLGELWGQLAQARFDLMVELRSVLTPEQWTRFQMLTTQWGRMRDRGR